MNDTNKLPAELLAQMEKPKGTKRIDAHSLTLTYIEHTGPATVDELLVYIWKVTASIKSRDYVYHVLMRLRKRGLIERVELEGETVIRHMLTPKGEDYLQEQGLEYTKVSTGETE